MPTQGGIVEQKTIGINIGTEGTFSNTELVDGKIQLKKLQEGSNEFSSMGFWTSNIIDIGDNFKDYGKVIITHTNTDNSRISVTTRSSSNSINFSQWTKIGEDGTILSPKNRYMQLRIELYAGTSIAEIKVENKEYVENNSFIENTTYLEGQYIIPTLTSNTSSPLGIAFSSSEAPTYGAWRAFDKVNSNRYQTVDGQHLNGYVGFAFNTESFTITRYMVRSSPTTTLTVNVKDWVIEGSNNTTNGSDGTWYALDTQTNQVWLSPNQDKFFDIPKTKPYKAFRLRWTANNGHTTQTIVGELDFFSAPIENIQLKRNYNYDMTQDSTWTATGTLHRKAITRSEWLKIDRLDVK